MFEKEAEKWIIDYVCKDCSRYKKCKSKEHCTCKDCSKEKWQNGAEFGYSKANEWHNLQENPTDLPKCEENEHLPISVLRWRKLEKLESE